MDILKQINNAVIYIEDNLCGGIDTDKIAGIALCPYDKFKRFFSYMTNMSVSEYIRKRRLTLAAYELLNGRTKNHRPCCQIRIQQRRFIYEGIRKTTRSIADRSENKYTAKGLSAGFILRCN